MAFVCDASVSLSWILPDEFSPRSTALLLLAVGEGIVVPQLWHLEIANQIGLKRRSGKLSAQDLDLALAVLAKVDIATDVIGNPDISLILDSMDRHRLTAYDAAYLELAHRNGLRLATFDKALVSAAREAGISLLN